MVESASGGLPGWVQNFVISLIQRLQLTVVRVPRSEAVEAGAIMPSPALLTTIDFAQEDELSYSNREDKNSFQVSRVLYCIQPLEYGRLRTYLRR